MNWYEWLGQSLAVIGAVIFVIAGVGLLRLRDVYMRISAVATAAGLGVAFVVGGTALVDPDLDDLVKVIIAIALQLATSVVGGVAIARSAVLSGHGFDDTDTSDLHD
ncbi:sodium:proton antiporter [Aeromicrobium sp. PE09-221]|uniref:cation:proton antiporter n=1 Tax=Aeromicrobium sp. PE09-221 TaxID=1898043 RepID=UPI000B3E565A|nr:monovalent cation/H(+) antiporter subunit G [Aeromicrobium sp. PE09-221]OUZ06836.1 sodium:proton antiporter [Aeromicrobium sp. PE09-221]